MIEIIARPQAGYKRPAWLLIATLPVFVVYVVLSVATIARTVDTSADLTPTAIDDLGLAWMGVHLLWVLPPVLASLAWVDLSRQVSGPLLGWVRVLAGVTIASATAYLVINALAYTAESATWGQSQLYPASVLASLLGGWFGVHLATMIMLVTLARSGIARRTALVVGCLYAAYVVFEILAYLPVILGPMTFAEFVGGVPPFVLGFFWAAIGVALLRTKAADRR